MVKYGKTKGGVCIVTEKRKLLRLLALAAAVLTVAVLAVVMLLPEREPPRAPSAQELAVRQKTIDTAMQWLGANEADGSHRPVIDLYNSHTPLARGYSVQYDDAWCATFVSAVAIACDFTDIIPTECGCQRQIELFKDLGRWEEDDNYVPATGDILYYSTDGSKQRDNNGWSDHVGIVVSVSGKTITVIEGNYDHQVKYRTIKVGDKWIRGYGLPNYASKI